jgi:hypothetical protein
MADLRELGCVDFVGFTKVKYSTLIGIYSNWDLSISSDSATAVLPLSS